MATKAKIDCSLNTTECILETIASILSEIQEQNSEYNWDPLTFGFTAIIGVLAIIVAGLAATQSFLAAGPGRTKAGVYAIGPWSQLNRREFDFAEMRFRTTSFTPILTLDSLNSVVLRGKSSISSYQDPARLRKGQEDYFPATWLALLSCLSLDNTKLWKEVKLTGADFIPSELSAVPTYGSIRFAVTLAMILSRGHGRLTNDRESGLPTVRSRHFNLIFRQHPLLGAIGFFEMYGKIPFEESPWHMEMQEMHERLLHAHGRMISSELGGDHTIDSFIDTGNVLAFGRLMDDDFMRSFTANVERQCPHGNQEPKPPCLNVLLYLKSSNACLSDFMRVHHTGLLRAGPLYLLIAPVPKSDLLPFFFQHKKAKLRERLDTLLLQSRFWGTKPTVYRDLSSIPPADDAHMGLQLTNAVVSWAKLNIKPDIVDMELSEDAYQLCSAYLGQSTTQTSEYQLQSVGRQYTLRQELELLDAWLKQIEPHVLCRSLTLSLVGDGIRQMIDTAQQQRIPEATSATKSATMPSSLDGVLLPVLHDKLGDLLKAMGKRESFNRLYLAEFGTPDHYLKTARHDTSEGLRKIESLWEIEGLCINDAVSGNGDGADGGQEHSSRSWKSPSATLHPLDDVLIYRAVLLTLIYCLSSDSSDLMDEDAYETIVPII